MSKSPMQTLWITKYALSEGIKKAAWDGKISAQNSVFAQGYYTPFKLGREAHLSEDEAIAAAEAQRSAKIISLNKQIERLHKVRFTSKGTHAK